MDMKQLALLFNQFAFSLQAQSPFWSMTKSHRSDLLLLWSQELAANPHAFRSQDLQVRGAKSRLGLWGSQRQKGMTLRVNFQIVAFLLLVVRPGAPSSVQEPLVAFL